jgi:hypothetical protein
MQMHPTPLLPAILTTTCPQATTKSTLHVCRRFDCHVNGPFDHAGAADSAAHGSAERYIGLKLSGRLAGACGGQLQPAGEGLHHADDDIKST